MMAYKKTTAIVFAAITGCGLLFLTACTQTNIFENNTAIPKQAWQSSFAATGSFAIADTSSAYNTYIVLRHTDAYRYNNIWLNIGIQPPGDSMRYNKMSVELATDATGWMGTGMNDIWELRQLVYLPFKKTGTYKYTISQIMRDDPLPAVLSAGVRVEKR